MDFRKDALGEKSGQAPGIQRNNRIGSTQNQQSLEQYPREQEQQMSEEQSLEISCNLPVCLHTPDFINQSEESGCCEN